MYNIQFDYWYGKPFSYCEGGLNLVMASQPFPITSNKLFMSNSASATWPASVVCTISSFSSSYLGSLRPGILTNDNDKIVKTTVEVQQRNDGSVHFKFISTNK